MKTPESVSMPFSLAPLAVGWERITVFYIPVVPIPIKSDEASDLMAVVSDALTAGGQVLWEESFSERETTFNFFDGYNIAAAKSVTRLANSMVEAFGTREFNDALAEAI